MGKASINEHNQAHRIRPEGRVSMSPDDEDACSASCKLLHRRGVDCYSKGSNPRLWICSEVVG
jgi:hypothetical protein